MKFLSLLLFVAFSALRIDAALITGSAKIPTTNSHMEFALEYDESRIAVASAQTKDEKQIFFPVRGVGTIYLNGDRKKGVEFFIMKFGGTHEALTGFYFYPGGYVGFLQINLFLKEKSFILFDPILSGSQVITGTAKN